VLKVPRFAITVRAMKHLWIVISAVALAGCGGGLVGGGNGLFGGREDPEAEVIRPVERPSEAAEAASSDESGSAFLGFTVASLGDATQPGLWMETPLVTEEQPGNVISESGQVVFLTLRPAEGDRTAGSRLSLQAFQALGIPLTELPTLTVRGISADALPEAGADGLDGLPPVGG
jgi:hypothetical protein